MASVKLKSAQLAPGVHIPGLASQTLTTGPGRSLDLDLDHGVLLVDTGKSEHILPLSAVVRIDPISEKYAPKPEAPKAAAPAPVAPPADDTTKFIKDPKTGAIVQAPSKK